MVTPPDLNEFLSDRFPLYAQCSAGAAFRRHRSDSKYPIIAMLS